jgi:hypothetical protein
MVACMMLAMLDTWLMGWENWRRYWIKDCIIPMLSLPLMQSHPLTTATPT